MDENDVEGMLCFKNSVDDKVILVNVLRENFDILQNYAWILSTAEWINCFLFSQSFWYFLECYLQLNLCFQKGQWLESAWWSPQQFEYLKEWEHGLPCLISSLGGLVGVSFTTPSEVPMMFVFM